MDGSGVVETVLDDVLGPDLDSAPLEVLEREMMSMAGHLAAGTARWLAWLAVYDRRRGYEGWGCQSSAQWLNMRCGVSLPAAREKVRVARALEGLPLIAAAMAAGELSYSKVRALTRMANVDNESDSLSLALDSTAAQLDRIVSGVLLSKRRAATDDETAFRERRLTERGCGDGTGTISVSVPVETCEQIMAAINARVEAIIEDASLPGQPRREVIEARGGIAALRADALADLACGPGNDFTPAAVTVIVTQTPDPDGDTVVAGVVVDSTVVEGTAVGPRIGERVLCDSKVDTVTAPVARVPGRAMRRALTRRDHGMCRFPGCGSTRRLHAHHVVHHANGGPTELENLILVCPFHHQTLHEGGFHARAVAGGGFEFIKPDGQTLQIGRSRGSVHALVASNAPLDIGPRTIEPRSASRLVEMPWLTSNFIHNESNHRKQRLQTDI